MSHICLVGEIVMVSKLGQNRVRAPPDLDFLMEFILVVLVLHEIGTHYLGNKLVKIIDPARQQDSNKLVFKRSRSLTPAEMPMSPIWLNFTNGRASSQFRTGGTTFSQS